jgi:hypothetical protein
VLTALMTATLSNALKLSPAEDEAFQLLERTTHRDRAAESASIFIQTWWRLKRCGGWRRHERLVRARTRFELDVLRSSEVYRFSVSHVDFECTGSVLMENCGASFLTKVLCIFRMKS